MAVLKSTLLLIISFITFQVAFSQSDNSLYFRQVVDNLSQTNVRCITQDSLGFIWMGTYGGLNRYDGKNIKKYYSKHESGKEFSDQRINDLLYTDKNKLWLATYQNIALYDYEQDSLVSFWDTKTKGKLDAFTLFEDEQQKLWVGTSHGIYVMNAQQNLERSEKASLEQLNKRSINKIYQDGKHRIWIGTDLGLYVFDDITGKLKRPSFENHDDSIRTNINDITSDINGDIWLASYKDGLYRLVETKSDHFKLKNYRPEPDNPYAIADNKIFCLLIDNEDKLWFGTERGGLGLYDPSVDGFISYKQDLKNDKALNSNSIWSIYQDNASRLWLGSYSQGVFICDPHEHRFNHVDKGNANNLRLKFNTVTSFLDTEKELWIGTDGGGISIWDKEKDTYQFLNANVRDPSSLVRDEVLCIHEDRNGQIWVGNWDGGFHKYIPKTGKFKVFTHDPNDNKSIANNNIFAIDEDSKGYLWLATWDGVSIFDPLKETFNNIGYAPTSTDLSSADLKNDNEVEIDDNSNYNIGFYHTSHSPSSNYLLSSNLTYDVEVDDNDGSVWVATILGLDRLHFDKNGNYSVQHYLPNEGNNTSISEAHTNCIYEDTKGRMWVGTEKGLNLFLRNTESFLNFYKRDGLPGNIVKAIIEDDQGVIWVSTNSGLAKLVEDGNEWKIISFSKEDGLQANEFFVNAAYKNEKGKLFFGGINGFNHFYPENIAINIDAPITQLVSFKIFNEEVKVGCKGSPLNKNITVTEHLTLNHTQSIFSIEYQGVNFTFQSKNKYAFRLDGFENDFNYVENRTIATYTNLDPGDYTFLVKSANHDDVWGETRALKITVLPPWWKTWWAQLLFYSSLILLGIGVFQARVSIIRKQKELLEKEVEQRTEEVTNQKKEIEEQASKLKALNHQKDHLFSIISHDLRSPLSSLLAITSLLDADILKGEDLHKAKQEITSRLNGISATMNNILYWAKDQMEGEKIKQERFDMYEIFEEMLSFYGYMVKNKGISLINEIPHGSFVFADKDQVRVIMRNLVGNAIKFTPKNGEIIIGMKKREDNRLIFYVKDSGQGMDDDKIKNLFEPNTNKSTLGTFGEKGVGLGLLLVKEYVEKNNGQIWVESEINKGSTFNFNFAQ